MLLGIMILLSWSNLYLTQNFKLAAQAEGLLGGYNLYENLK
jgi:hypothetical protein